MDKSRLKLTDAFTEAMAKLNPGQREAVQTLDGPVLVLAGPGTGKTEVLSLRVGQILAESGLHAENILCLTFSRAGVASMKRRLAQLLGPESGKVTVETFHSFAEGVLRYPSGGKVDSRKLLTPAHRFMILEQLLGHPATGGEYYEKKVSSMVRLTSLSRIFDLLKKEGISGQDLRQFTLNCMVRLPMHPSYMGKRAALNQDGKNLMKKLKKFSDTIAPMFEAYQNLLKEHGYVDYEDLLAESISQLHRVPSQLLALQMRYQYILVDEFQDTNEKQLELLLLLTNGVEKANVFIVGDDDQCIYRFQGASRRNFETIRKRFPDLRTILLDTNYRSTADILERAFGIIESNPYREAVKAAPLKAGAPEDWKLNPVTPHLRVYDEQDQEDYDIALQIKALMEDRSFTGTAAVLYRRHSQANGITKWLDQWNIPYRFGSQRDDLLALPEGKRLLWLTRVIGTIGNDPKLAGAYLSHYMMSAFGRDEFLKVHLRWKNNRVENSFIAWLENQQDDLAALMQKDLQSCRELHACLESPMDEKILESLLNIAGVVQEDQRTGWGEFLESFLRSDRLCTLASFCSLLHYHEVREVAVEHTPSAHRPQRVVLSTIWGSKGLEYDAVFVIGCTVNNWEEHTPPKQQIRVPELLNRSIPDEPDAEEDLRRLIYVAATRAKCVLVFSYSVSGYKGRLQKHTSLLQGLIEAGKIMLERKGPVELPAPARSFPPLKEDAELRELVTKRIDDFMISASSLYKWFESAELFFVHNICKVPELPQMVLSFGNYVHKILEHLSRNPLTNMEPEKVKEVSDHVFSEFSACFHATHHTLQKSHAVRVISEYLSQFGLPPEKGEFELSLSAELTSDVRLFGILDRVEVSENAVVAIDYKTGSTKWDPSPFVSPEEPGSGHWRQAMMYRYLLEANYPGRSSYEIRFQFLEQETQTVFDYKENMPFRNWLMNLKKEIRMTFA